MEAVGVIVNKTGDTITIEKKEVDEEGNTTSTAVGTTPTPDEIHHEDEVEDMSENESEGTQPEEVISTYFSNQLHTADRSVPNDNFNRLSRLT